ncbi:MAG: chemotaxis protein CheB [Bacteroidia bacterium]
MKSGTPQKNKSQDLPKSENLFPVVGIGASAGGLDAFKQFLQAIPEDSGMAYVLVQHLDPEHESLLTDILRKVTLVPVMEITDEIKVEPNAIYVIPRNKILVASNGVLRIAPRPSKTKYKQNLPIDIFFTSLAEVYQSRAIGVVLSGTASDGTLGLKAIKDHGGITIAQDEESAAFDGMPNSAVEAGVVDFILRPDEIPKKLLELTNVLNTPLDVEQKLPLENEEAFRQINTVLRIRKGTDFTYYKQTTIRRRVLRRIAIAKTKSPSEYLTYLRENPQEQDILYQDLLIQVTSFFRDPKTFDNLSETIIPTIVNNQPLNETIRIWVAGCSTGEEAYSIAICFAEFWEKHTSNRPERSVQIFATDLSESAISKARAGIYDKIELAGLTSQRIQNFFTKTNNTYLINKKIRDMCVFANHNFLKDPPFGKMNLISCRNVLIYMEPYLQKKVLTTFHYALNPRGVLLLGKSETTSGVPDLFTPSVKNDKIYIRKDVPGKFMQVLSTKTEHNISNLPLVQKKETMRSDFQKMADDIILSKYTPPGVVVNEGLDIVQFRGSTSNYLEQASGKPSHNLLVMAKKGLSFELRNIINKVKKGNAQVKKENIPVEVHGMIHNISIEAIPLQNTLDPYYLILFHDYELTDKSTPPKIKKKAAGTSEKNIQETRIRQLEQELAQIREDMRGITEDQEAVNEELQSANEELLSGNEELQSLNEELETSKEELQSTNEELTVVNQEILVLNGQLDTEKNYAQSIVENIRESLLVLDKNLRIKTANTSFYKTFRVTRQETEGVLIYHLGNKQWDIPLLRTLLEKILPEKSVINDFEVSHTFPNIGAMVMLLNAREVVNKHNSETLILLSIEDITEKKQQQLKESKFQEVHTKELEDKIRQRTLELRDANEALLAKNVDLVKMNKELEAFAYVSSHDMKEPLRKIQTFTGRILEKESQNLSDHGKIYFQFVQDAASQMQTLIEDLLSFSRLNISERKFEITDLNLIIEEVKATFKDIIEEKQATFEVGKLDTLNIIGFQFRQIMHNIVGNALKFSKPDLPPHIIINSRIVKGGKVKNVKLFTEKTYCHISISDNGIGFKKEFSEKIFEVFQKLHNKEQYAGTGIGLAIVKKIVENHNGVITATGKLNIGATFDIFIPTS